MILRTTGRRRKACISSMRSNTNGASAYHSRTHASQRDFNRNTKLISTTYWSLQLIQSSGILPSGCQGDRDSSKALLREISEEQNRIMDIMSGSEISTRLAPSILQTLLDSVSKTKGTSSESKNRSAMNLPPMPCQRLKTANGVISIESHILAQLNPTRTLAINSRRRIALSLAIPKREQ